MNGTDAHEEPDVPPEAIDPGEPITALRTLAEEPAVGFLARIRNAIQRRLLVSHLMDLSWFAPVLVALEYLKVIFGLVDEAKQSGEERK